LRQLAGNATGLGNSGLSPSGIVDIGFAIFDKVHGSVLGLVASG
jgi:type IV secretion system protein TrbL